MICTRCGKELAEWHFGDDHYCQMCWEAHCSEEWWRLNVWQNGVARIWNEDGTSGIATGANRPE